MGRKKIVLSAEQIEQRKAQYWGETRNKARREKYNSDPAYREKVRDQVKGSYRKARTDAGLPVRTDNARDSLPILPTIGITREVHMTDGTKVFMLTFTTDELARALGRNQQVLYRWHASEQFPEPVVLAVTPSNFHQPVYTESEARALIDVFGKHQDKSQYYRKHHTGTTDALFAVTTKVRNHLSENGVTLAGELE